MSKYGIFFKSQEAFCVCFFIALGFLPLVLEPFALWGLRDVALHALLAVSVAYLWRTGLTTFGHAVFFGVGAYTATIGGTQFELTGLTSVLLGVLIGAALAFFFGLALLYRGLRDAPFTVFTLALSMMAFLLVKGLKVTGRDSGLTGARSIELGSFSTSDAAAAYYLALGVLFIPILVLTRLCKGRHGLLLSALRSNEERARALGYNTDFQLVIIFSISGGLAALAGSLYSSMNGLATSDMVSPTMSTEVLVWAALGGRKTFLGPAISTYLLWQLQQHLISLYPLVWQLVIGLVVLIIVKANVGFIRPAVYT